MCADHDAVKGTEIAGAGVVCALGNGAADGLVGGVAGVSAAGILVLVHFRFPFLVCPPSELGRPPPSPKTRTLSHREGKRILKRI